MRKKGKAKGTKRKSESSSDAAALVNLLSASTKRNQSGLFITLPFRIFEMLRFPKSKRFFCSQISDDEIFLLLPQRAADQLKDLMELESFEDRLCVFRDLDARSDMAVEVQKKLRVGELVTKFGFKLRAAERVVRAGNRWALEAVRWLSDILKSPDRKTRKMLLFLLNPHENRGKVKPQDLVDRLEFTRIPVPQVKGSAEFMSFISAAYEALKLGFPFGNPSQNVKS